MTDDVVKLYKHCKDHGRAPKNDPERSEREKILKTIASKNKMIRKENEDHGLYSELGIVNPSVLQTWYTRDEPSDKSKSGVPVDPKVKLEEADQGQAERIKQAELDLKEQNKKDLYEKYVLWITHQFPISFLRSKANCIPSYRGKYPSNKNLRWYYMAQHGIDPYDKRSLSTTESDTERSRFDGDRFLRSIYPKDDLHTRPPIPPNRSLVKQEPLEETPKFPTVRRHLNLVSYGVSTEQFEPGYTFFGKKIIAVDKHVREGRNPNSRLYLVEMAEGIAHIYNQSEVGGERIFEVCRDMPDILNIVRHKNEFVGKDKPLPNKGAFQAHGWGIKYVALKAFMNSPAHAQPMTMVVVHYRKEAYGELMEIGMSKACLTSLVGDTTAQTFISRALAGPNGEIHKDIWPYLPTGIQRKVWSRAAVVDARLGKVAQPPPSAEEVARVLEHLKLNGKVVQEVVNNGSQAEVVNNGLEGGAVNNGSQSEGAGNGAGH